MWGHMRCGVASALLLDVRGCTSHEKHIRAWMWGLFETV
jgi:hypothetical protein